MNRRSMLQYVGIGGITGSSGCVNIPYMNSKYRLWFIRIHNGTLQRQDLSLRVLAEGEVVFENYFENIPSFKETKETESTFAAMESARLVEGEWTIEKNTYVIEHRLSEENSVTRVDIRDTDKFESDNIGINMQMLGGNVSKPEIVFDVNEFETKKQASDFVNEVTNESK